MPSGLFSHSRSSRCCCLDLATPPVLNGLKLSVDELLWEPPDDVDEEEEEDLLTLRDDPTEDGVPRDQWSSGENRSGWRRGYGGPGMKLELEEEETAISPQIPNTIHFLLHLLTPRDFPRPGNTPGTEDLREEGRGVLLLPASAPQTPPPPLGWGPTPTGPWRPSPPWPPRRGRRRRGGGWSRGRGGRRRPEGWGGPWGEPLWDFLITERNEERFQHSINSYFIIWQHWHK